MHEAVKWYTSSAYRKGARLNAETRTATSQAAAAYAQLRHDIIRCKLAPGESTTEATLAARYGFGKTPIREALTNLAHDGLVQRVPKVGYRISPVTLNDARSLHQVRAALERLAVRLATGRLDESTLRRLDELCKVGYDPAEPDTIDAFLLANTEIHTTMAAASGNPRLYSLLSNVLQEIERLVYLAIRIGGPAVRLSQTHDGLLKALAAGDADAAVEVNDRHMAEIEQMIITAIVNSPGIGDASVTIGG